MEEKFWQERWAADQTGFHEGAPNALLAAHASALEGYTRVYVPLCGMAVDLGFLQSRGHVVFGTEIVRSAIDRLFARTGASTTTERIGPYLKHRGGGLEVLEGDAFALEPAHLGGQVDAIYDRAALVALDPKTREAYVRSFTRVLRAGGRVLLVAFDYPQEKIDGPPWAVSDGAVHALFDATFDVTLLETRSSSAGPKFRAVGIDALEERAYLLTKRP